MSKLWQARKGTREDLKRVSSRGKKGHIRALNNKYVQNGWKTKGEEKGAT